MTHMNRFTVDMYTSLFHFILNQFSVKKKKMSKSFKIIIDVIGTYKEQ